MSQFAKSLYHILIFACLHISAYAQIEDPLLVNQILSENRNLDQLYANFPNALQLYKQSQKHKIQGIGREIGGVLLFSGGAYLTYCGVISGIAGSITQSSDITGLGFLTGGVILMTTGISTTRSGGRQLDLAKKIKRGSAQQYIWDIEAQGSTLNKGNDIGFMILDIGLTNVKLIYIF